MNTASIVLVQEMTKIRATSINDPDLIKIGLFELSRKRKYSNKKFLIEMIDDFHLERPKHQTSFQCLLVLYNGLYSDERSSKSMRRL